MLFQGAGKFSREQVRVGSPGGIFNIEFSGDGKVQAAKSKIKININTKDQVQNRCKNSNYQWEGAGGRLREKEHSPL